MARGGDLWGKDVVILIIGGMSLQMGKIKYCN